MSKKISGKEIKALRIALNETQVNFSKRLGLKGYAWLSSIENDHAKVSERLEIILRTLIEKYGK